MLIIKDRMHVDPDIILKFAAFLLALCAHEFSHGWVANKLGDPTARLMGRLTLNPFAHADPIGTFVLPIMGLLTNASLIGWAKPVPVNSRNLKNEKMGMFWVALAGPGCNIILAIIGSLIFGGLVRFFETASFFHMTLELTKTFVAINLVLAIFNLIPMHPLDGGKVFAIFLPDHINRKLEEMQFAFMITMMVLFVASDIGSYIIGRPVAILMELFLKTGLRIFGIHL